MENNRPLILITNDDGIEAKGISHLISIAVKLGEVIVVAPEAPQSAKSSALTVNSPLMAKNLESIHGAKVFTVNGTPVDCVKVAMHALLYRKPDLVLSGINHGSNAAVNNLYSGTMGAAMEGCVLGVPSIGYSLLSHSPRADFEPLTPFIEDITARVLKNGLPDRQPDITDVFCRLRTAEADPDIGPGILLIRLIKCQLIGRDQKSVSRLQRIFLAADGESPFAA